MKRQLIPTLAGLFLLYLIGRYLDQVAHQELVQLIRFTLYAGGYTLILVLASLLILFVLSVRERVLTRQAQRRLVERQVEVQTIISETHGVFVRELNPQAVWRPLHLSPAPCQTGRSLNPSPYEVATWQTWTLRHRSSSFKPPEQPLLSAPIQVDLLAMSDTIQRGLIVGPSDSGKTTVLQWLISRRLVTSKVVVIDPHAYPDKWQGAMVIGTGRNYPEIERALIALVQLMTKRYDDIGKGAVSEGNHPRLTILIDEWRAIVQNVKSAGEAIKALLTESRKAAMTVFVATHSDRAKPLGLEGEYDLKDGFAVIRLAVVNGQRQATLDTGSGEVPVILPGPFHNPLPQDSDSLIDLDLKVEPTVTEATILHLHEQGESYNEIARQVYGSTGGKQTELIKRIIDKFN